MTDFYNDPKNKEAIALHYDGKNTPVLTAKGKQEIAEQIIKMAEKHGIPLHHDPALTQVLSNLNIGEQIPYSLYVAVAEIIAFVYYLKGKTPDSK